MRKKLKLDEASVGAILIARHFEGKAKEKGITLVALIITIIVLLILSAVTIITFTETGLLQTASKGTENYANAQEYEQKIMDNLDKHANKVIANIIEVSGSSEGGTNPKEPEETPVPLPTLKSVELPTGWNGNKVEAVEDEDGAIIPIPKGFSPSGNPNERKVATGLVIKQDGTNNEFVWVPVTNQSEMFGVDKEGNFLGKLYDFGTYSSSEDKVVERNPPIPLNWTEKNGVMSLTTSTEYHEPDILTDTVSGDASTTVGRGIEQLKTVVGITGNSNTTILNKWKAQLNKEFNDMKTSVNTYGGFFIGRYETGNLSQEKAVVERGNEDINNQNWYTMYQKSKTIMMETEISSSMIWGCQWDALMKWFLTSNDEEVRTYVTSTDRGNYTGSCKPTGYYAVNNIYDIGGNVLEATLETTSATHHACRGGNFNSSQFLVSDRGGGLSYTSKETFGARCTLII